MGAKLAHISATKLSRRNFVAALCISSDGAAVADETPRAKFGVMYD